MSVIPSMDGDNIFSNTDLLVLANISAGAYLANNETFLTQMDAKLVTQIPDETCPITIATYGGYKICAFQGTSLGHNILEVLDDLDGSIVALDDMRVHAGFWNSMAFRMPLIREMMDKLEGDYLITGHSLGGVRAHLAKAFFPEAQIVSFGAPKGADDMFWKRYYPSYPPIRVVNNHDIVPVLPPDGPWTQPAKLTWIHDGIIELTEKRKGLLQDSISDHFITTGYVAALEKLVAT
jgi:hypothetical protein